jgi:uncharacterized membrane protein
MWRFIACPRLIEPLLRTVKRLAALFFVFIFGMGAVLSVLDGVQAAVVATRAYWARHHLCPARQG